MKKSILFLVLLQSLLIFAQAPQKMTYQSVVRNSANVLLANQAVGVRISILEGSLSGTAVYSETHTVTTNANGLFTLEAGGGTPTEGVFADIAWGNGAHYIKSEIDPTGGTNYTLSATKELLNVPYALYAVNGITTAQADAITAQASTITALQAQIAAMQDQISLLQQPQLTTAPIGALAHSSATSGGTITSTGLGDIITRGLVWSTLSNPTIVLATKTTDGSGMGSFTSTITGLTPETTYYVRAYATNSFGTIYGAEVSFTTLLTTVTIGTQTWMQKNLYVTTYRNGDIIPEVQDATVWANYTTGAWCHYNNDPANDAIYGKLYNWYAVNDPRGLAIAGYHIPSDTEFNTVTDMKDPAGFAGLPGGYRSSNGTFSTIGSNGTWWSSSEANTTYAWYRGLIYDNSTTDRSSYSKTNGFSVRCLRD